MRRFTILTLFSFIFISRSFASSNYEPRNGDLIFIVNPAGQGKAIQLATGSRYTHVGIIFIENGQPYVYHAVEPVSKNTLQEFIALSADGKYEIKRLKAQELITDKTVSTMSAEARSCLGRHYDMVFSWSDEELYCSEFVWKLYSHALSLNIGEPKPLKEFDLSHPMVKNKINDRYGNKIPYEEKMISPGDMFNSDLLESGK